MPPSVRLPAPCTCWNNPIRCSARSSGLEEVPFDQPWHGFGRVFRAPGIPLIVVEPEVSSSGKLQPGQTQGGEQGSPTWIADKAARMADPRSAQWSPANEHIARPVQELGPENVPALAVVTNPNSQMVDVHVRRGDAGWMNSFA